VIESSELLRSYAEGIRRLSGAGSVSLFVPPSLSGFSRSMLLHDGPLPPIAELADLETAQRFADGAQPEPATEMVASSTAGGGLVPLPAVHSAWALAVLPEQLVGGSRTPGRRRSDSIPEDATQPSAWLGIRFDDERGSVFDRLGSIDLPAALTDRAEHPTWWRWLFAMGGALASHTSQVSAILKDPITGLPDRAGFQAVLSEELEKARQRKTPLSLILVNPDDFAAINERFGRVAGDEIVREISGRLRSALRSSDPLSRYGGVIFAITLADTALEAARSVAEKLIRSATEAAFLDGAVRLGFSAGVAVFENHDKDIGHHLDLIRRADQALNAAKRVGGGVVIDWEQRSGAEETGNFDRLTGIFTGNMTKDYRNMVLLSDTIDVIAVNQEFDHLAGEVVEKLYSTFKPDRVALFARDEEGNFELTRGLTRTVSDSGPQVRVETVELGARERELMGLAVAEGRPQELPGSTDDEESSSYAVPLIATDECLGCLFIEGRESSLALEAADLIFLRALASQLAVALDRARLAELEKRRQETERRKLRAELNELRQALQQAKLVYRSQEMDSLLATARRVAPTDATILITGESGTGKELLARTIHEVSPRSDQVMAVVDCGAIPATLIESELFGHERGAYTGAQQRRHGRIAEANRGTVMLDEIGELPLETQSKLLRFVQEKQFTPLGGSRPRRVDVRIIAATNRELATEVRAGRFREDLYYRLNVVRLEIPPLRDRTDDILHLARHFLETYSVQYQKSIRSLTPAAEDQLMRYEWPGNVRELQNRMMQAVILCETSRLGPEELSLPLSTFPSATSAPRAAKLPVAAPAPPAAEDSAIQPQPPTPMEQFEDLRRTLGRQIEATGKTPGRLNFPLGRWLGDDLILEAVEAGSGIARRGAAIVGIPETTFRRRLQKASEQNEAGLATRSGTWDEVRQILASMVRRDDLGNEPMLARTEQCLLREIVSRFPGDVRTGSALLGVTPPTFRRRVAALQAARNGSSTG
jgi:diguanylate cyclase (GGDEF)-like protein